MIKGDEAELMAKIAGFSTAKSFTGGRQMINADLRRSHPSPRCIHVMHNACCF